MVDDNILTDLERFTMGSSRKSMSWQSIPPQSSALVQRVRDLKAKATDEFSRSLIEGGACALENPENPLRLNFFSTAMRILFEHIMASCSPNAEVIRAPWFTPDPESKDGRPTRWQRIVFAIQGGLSEAFVLEKLHIDPLPLRKRLLTTIDELSKHIHSRENTIIDNLAEQDAEAEATLLAVIEFLQAISDCRAAVLEPIEEALDDAAVEALVSETLESVDELATHWSLEEIYVHDTSVQIIGADTIIYRASGSISVVLQWGSNSDVRRGDGVEIEESFPFHVDFELPLDTPWAIEQAERTHHVDTKSWSDEMHPDDLDNMR